MRRRVNLATTADSVGVGTVGLWVRDAREEDSTRYGQKQIPCDKAARNDEVELDRERLENLCRSLRSGYRRG